MEWNIHLQVLSLAFLIGLVAGAAAERTSFCTMGAVSDWVNMGSTARMRAWLLAIAVALGGVVLLEARGLVNLGDGSFPPYRSANFAWLRHLLGGALFGVGMTLASGCGNKTLVRLGGGNLKSLVVLVIAGIAAWAMMWTDFYKLAFDSWLAPLSINLARYGMPSQTLDSILGAGLGMKDTQSLHLALGLLIAVSLAIYAFRGEEFRADGNHALGGCVMGAAVVAAWVLSGGPMGQEWREWAEMAENMPSRVMVQSMTFISPMGDSVRWALAGGEGTFINFGICTMLGVITGAFLHALWAKELRFEWFRSWLDLRNHALGAVLMGIGGVLAMGCSIGQGVSGVSTLALGSFLTLVAIIASAVTTLKLMYRFA